MRVVFLILTAWLQTFIGYATHGQISAPDSTSFYTALLYQDTVFLHKTTPTTDSIFYTVQDTSGLFGISAFTTTLILVTKESDYSLRITKFTNFSVDTTYLISTPFICDSIVLYNDGHLHPSYPVWYLLCTGDSGLHMTHSTNYGDSFYPFDTVLTDTGIISVSFTTSISLGRDILHVLFNKKEGSASSLYLLNGTYPDNFGTPVFIDSLIPYDAHFSIYAMADTIFTAYERLTSATIPDKDLYLAVSFYGGSDWSLGTISITTLDEIFPVIVPIRDTLRIYYIAVDTSSATSYINERPVPSPYTHCLSESRIFEGTYLKLYSDPVSSFEGMLSISTNDSSYFVYNESSAVKEQRKRSPHKEMHGIFTIDGRKVIGQPKRGVYIKDGKGVVILK